MRNPLTPFQIELIERARHRESSRGIITAQASQRPTATTGIEAEWATARYASQGRAPRDFGRLDADSIWARWNAPKAASMREQVEQDLHREAAVDQLDAAEIMRHWNSPKPAA